MDKSVANIITKLLQALLGKAPWSVSSTVAPDAYGEYLNESAPSPQELSAQTAQSADGLPLFAIAIAGEPQGQEQALSRTLTSLSSQTYPNWKLISSVREETYDYLMYMWPGDLLSPNGLHEFAHAPKGSHLIYCDEDILCPEGRRDPLFKPELNRFTQLSCDMLGSGVAVSRSLLDAAGPMSGSTGSDRYAFNLRCMEKASSHHHIPKVLYSCARSREPGPEARTYLEKLSPGQTVLPGSWQGSFAIEAHIKRPTAAIIIYGCNQYQSLMALLNSIDRTCMGDNVSILVADRGSTDRRTLSYYEILQRNGAARVFMGGDTALPQLLNRAAGIADRDVAIFLSSNMEVLSVNWADGLLRQTLRHGVGAAGPKIIGPQGQLLHTGTVIGMGGWFGSPYANTRDDSRTRNKKLLVDTLRGVSALSICCMATPMDVFFNLGCFDESFQEQGFDVEFCLRLNRRGYGCIYTPGVTVRSAARLPSMAQAGSKDKMRCYDAIRDTLLSGDPNISPNFNWASTIPQPVFPSRPPALLNELYTKR